MNNAAFIFSILSIFQLLHSIHGAYFLHRVRAPTEFWVKLWNMKIHVGENKTPRELTFEIAMDLK